jgi:ATPase subunit of ABC transporter with duplicated ATPase domains
MGEPDADFDSLLTEQGELMEVIENHDGWELDARIEQAMDALRCPPGDADVTVLSGGERRRVALCKLLLEAPDLLLLDEPTNHLDAESVAWLEQHLEKYAGTVVAVTHDRYFLDNVAQWILELDRGRAYPYEGNYSTYLETKAARLKVEGAKDAKRQKRLQDELEWVRSGAKARQAKSKARLPRYEEMAAEADKYRKLDFEEIQIPPGPRLGNVVVETTTSPRASATAADRRPVLHAAAQRHRRRRRPNGAARPRCSRCSSARRSPTTARSRSARRQGLLRRAEPQRHRPEEDAVGGRLRRPRPHQGRQRRDALAGLRRRVRVQGPGPAEAGRRAVRR